jgi:hypothetical protein
MSEKMQLTGVYEVDVNSLISKLDEVKNRLRLCSQNTARSQNFSKLWGEVESMHKEIHALTEELKAHEIDDDVIHLRHDEELEEIVHLIHGMNPEEVKELQDLAEKIAENARHTNIKLTSLVTGRRVPLMAVDTALISELKECLK